MIFHSRLCFRGHRLIRLWLSSAQNGAEDFGEELQESISKLDAEILRMAPNMKAGEK